MVQARACIIFLASEAMVAFLYMLHRKSHSASPPAAMALQYTVDFRFGLILKGKDRKTLSRKCPKRKFSENKVIKMLEKNTSLISKPLLVSFRVVHPLFEPSSYEFSAALYACTAGQRDRIHLIVSEQ